MATLLIIEDEPDIRQFYREALSGRYELDFAVDGQDGYQKGCSNDYDLIISDLKMPNWSGAETVAVLDMLNDNQRYLIVSGYLMVDEYQELLKTVPSIMGQLQKPVRMDDLISTIESILLTSNECNNS